MWKNAIPLSYRHPDADAGAVYAATMSDEPPLRVRERQFGDDDDKLRVVVEFENIMGKAVNQMAAEFGLERDVDEVLRVALNLSCTRKLCYHLLHTLAELDDPVVCRIKDELDQVLADMRREKEEDNGPEI